MATDLSKLSKEALEEVLGKVELNGVDITPYLDNIIPDGIKSIASVLHGLLCYKNHLNGECDFYKEVEDCWSQPNHKEYLSIAQRLAEYEPSIVKIEGAIEDLKTIFRILEEAAYCRPIIMLLLQKFLQLNPPSNQPL